MARTTTGTRSVRGRFARGFAGFGIAGVLAATAMGAVAVWSMGGSLGRDHLAALDEVRAKEGLERIASRVIARALDDFMRERIVDVRSWASAPVVVAAARQAHAAHRQAGLLDLEAQEVEGKFEVRKSLGRFPVAASWLREEVYRSAHFDRVLLTDRNGYNVVATHKKTDFVQSDEEWWQRAWSAGFALGPLRYQEDTGSWAVELAMRVDDPMTDLPVGVLQAAFGIAPIQALADRWPGRGTGGRVTVVDGEGLLLAETDSRHSSVRIMNEKVNLRSGRPDPRQAVFGGEPAGRVSDDDWVTGWSRTGDGERYADLARGLPFEGLGWGVVVQSRADGGAGGPAAGTDAAVAKIAERRTAWLAMQGGGAVLLVLLFCGIGVWMGRRAARPIRELRTMAADVSMGTAAGEVKLETDDELAEIAAAFDRMRRSLQLVMRMTRGGGGGGGAGGGVGGGGGGGGGGGRSAAPRDDP